MKEHGTLTLREAKAPLKDGEGRFQAEIGLMLRGAIRRAAAECGVDWFEQKGWLDSYFVFRGPANDAMRLYHAFENHQKKMDNEGL